MTHPLSMKAAAERNPQEEKMKSANPKPMDQDDRIAAYKDQSGRGRLTLAQRRRFAKKGGHNGTPVQAMPERHWLLATTGLDFP